LPDGIFSNQKFKFGKFLLGFAMEDVDIAYLCPFDIFHGHFVYFMAILYISWPFGIFSGYLVHFSSFGML
jgi:hypothetical protein